jgi:hypothetical protein
MDKNKVNGLTKIRQINYLVDGNYVNISEKKELIFELSANEDSDRYENKLSVIFDINDNKKCCFNLFEYPYNYKRISFNSVFFTMNEIHNLSKVYNFDVIINPFYNNKIQGALTSINFKYNNIYGLIKKCNNNYFLLILCSTRTLPAKCASDDLDDTYYIHGIWEVELSDEFKNKIGL